jgi:hypothetical protein
MMSFRNQASSAKMTPFGGKLTALVCHQTKKVNNAEELTYLSLQALVYLNFHPETSIDICASSMYLGR